MTSWIHLTIAGVLEIAWAVGLKYTAGLSRLWPSTITILAMLGSFYFLALAARSLPIGTAYAVWTGIGVVGTTVLGIILLNESRDAARLTCIAFIAAGIIGLKWLTPAAP